MQTKSAAPVIQNVQALRAIAALFAVLAHLQHYVADLVGLSVPLGGVDLFFVISGFIMVYTTMEREITPRKFLANRFVRIVPLYWAATLAVFTIALIAPALVQATHADFGALVKSLLFIPFMKDNGQVQPTLFVGWTLNYEIAFYLLFAAGLFLRSKTATFMSVIGALFAVALIGQIAAPQGVIASFFSSSIILNFVLGMMVGMAVPWMPKAASAAGKYALIAAAFAALATATMAPALWPAIPSVLTCGLPSATLVACVMALERCGWRVTSPTFILLGDATYSIYLSHPFVTNFMQKATIGLHVGPVATIGFLVFSIALASVVGVLIYKYIELPLGRLARKIRLPGAPVRTPRPLSFPAPANDAAPVRRERKTG